MISTLFEVAKGLGLVLVILFILYFVVALLQGLIQMLKHGGRKHE